MKQRRRNSLGFFRVWGLGDFIAGMFARSQDLREDSTDYTSQIHPIGEGRVA